MNIFLDTNVFADAFLNRDDGSAKRALKFLEEQNTELFLNDISIINITYICKNKMKQKKPQIYYINCMINKNK